MDPVLTPMDTPLDDDVLFQAVKADLSTRCPQTASDGCPSPPVEGMRRLLVVKHFYGGRFPHTAHDVSDRLVLRQLCRVSVAPVPDQSPLHRWAQRLQPATLHRVLDHLVHLACQRQVPQGRTLRLDGTVVSTTLPPPTDSTLRHDGVRRLRRAVGQAATWRRDGAVVPQETATPLAPQARDTLQRLMAVVRQRGEAAAERLHTP